MAAIVKILLPVALAVPATTPVDAFRVSPEGKAPAVRVQAYGYVPPLADSVAEYTAPTVPAGSEDVVMVSGSPIMTEKALVAIVRMLSETPIVNPDAPADVGVPEMTPVAGFSIRPAGSESAATNQFKVPHPAVAARDVEYTVPVVAARSVPSVVIARVGIAGFTIDASKATDEFPAAA